jgi:hypothetical protein
MYVRAQAQAPRSVAVWREPRALELRRRREGRAIVAGATLLMPTRRRARVAGRASVVVRAGQRVGSAPPEGIVLREDRAGTVPAHTAGPALLGHKLLHPSTYHRSAEKVPNCSPLRG